MVATEAKPCRASSLVLNNQLRFQGSAAYAMVGIASGAILNIAVALQHPHEEGVCHVVEGGDQHTDDTGDCQTEDQASYGGFPIIFLMGLCLLSVCFSI